MSLGRIHARNSSILGDMANPAVYRTSNIRGDLNALAKKKKKKDRRGNLKALPAVTPLVGGRTTSVAMFRASV